VFFDSQVGAMKHYWPDVEEEDFDKLPNFD